MSKNEELKESPKWENIKRINSNLMLIISLQQMLGVKKIQLTYTFKLQNEHKLRMLHVFCDNFKISSNQI